ncbi:MAG TPA: sodium:solute symporter [Ktedonobacterales bacterium]|nr:sodium:solute symporter [Ktedonobacterales bacterium]
MPKELNWTALTVFIVLFAFVTILGFIASRWRRGDLNQLNEWGLGGRRFGTVVTWFLLGGDLYTAYTFIAVPALVYGSGAIGLFAVPYTIIVYPFVLVVMPRLWSVCHKHGYVTASDFVRGRYGSSGLALAVAFTGILATMPYIALQLVGIEVVLAAMGIQGDIPLIVAFLVLAAYTYFSGLRAPAMIALVKDAIIYITIIIAVIAVPIYISNHLGNGSGIADGYATLFAKVPDAKLLLAPKTFTVFGTLALGSALALFMYPHAITGTLAANSGRVIKRNAALLPAYSFLLGLIALLGFMALVVGVVGVKPYGAQFAVPGLFNLVFPAWFAGFAFAAIAIGALVPASVMSIAAANLFTRNIYKEYFRRTATDREEASVAKLVSLIVKLGALAFVIALPLQQSINFQLLGGVWILQTFPAIVFGLYTRWFHRWALLIGWFVGMALGTYMAYLQSSPITPHFASSTYSLHLFGQVIPGYAAFYAFIANIVVTVVLSFVFNLVGLAKGTDSTAVADYEAANVVAVPAAAL